MQILSHYSQDLSNSIDLFEQMFNTFLLTTKNKTISIKNEFKSRKFNLID